MQKYFKYLNREFLVIALQGAVMGVAEIIPGVSGSTLALIMGIYDRFIELLHDFSDFAKLVLKTFLGKVKWPELWQGFKSIDWKFCIALLLGMGVALGLLSNVLSYGLEYYPQYMNAIFFGMILASVGVPWAQIKNKSSKSWLLAIVTAAATFLILGFARLQPQENPSLVGIFLGGIVAITGMVLPGVSGSFILLLLGLYEYVIDAVKALTHLSITTEQLTRVVLFVLGIVTGFVFFVRLIKLGLDKARDELMAIMTGLLVGSLRVLWPFFDRIVTGEGKYDFTDVVVSPEEMVGSMTVMIVILMTIAFVVIYILNRRSNKQN